MRQAALAAALTLWLGPVLAAPPDQGRSWLEKGRALLAQGRQDDARAAVTKALGDQRLALTAEDADLLSRLAAVDQSLGRFEDAARELSAAVKAKPGDYWVRMQLGRAYAGLGRFSEARRTFEQAKKADHRKADAYINEGYMDINLGDQARAERDIRELIAVDSTNPAGYHHMGSMLSAEGRNAEAERYFREALRLFDERPPVDPEDRLHAMAWLGDVLLNQGRLPEAEATYRRGLDASRSDPAFQAKFLTNLGIVYAAQGHVSDAERSYEQATRICDKSSVCRGYGSQAFLAFARFEADRGRVDKAAGLADRAWESSQKAQGQVPTVVGAPSLLGFDLLADLFLRLGEPQKAQQAYERLLPLRGFGSSQELAMAEAGLAGIYAEQGRRREAAQLYQQAAQIFSKSGAASKARDALAKAAKLDAAK